MIEALLVNTCTIERWPTRTRDANFLLQPAWVPVSSGVPCNIQHKSGTMSIGPSGQDVVYDAVGYFLTSADIKPRPQDAAHGDRITDDATGAVYQVRAVFDQVGHGEFKKALLKAV